MANENVFQRRLIKEIERRIPGALAIKNDSGYIQGIPDWTIFFENKYAMLETKKSMYESHRPNQDYYIDYFKQYGVYASFVYPENMETVLRELVDYFNVPLLVDQIMG